MSEKPKRRTFDEIRVDVAAELRSRDERDYASARRLAEKVMGKVQRGAYRIENDGGLKVSVWHFAFADDHRAAMILVDEMGLSRADTEIQLYPLPFRRTFTVHIRGITE